MARRTAARLVPCWPLRRATRPRHIIEANADTDGRTRARRDQGKHVTLIRAMALLHQHQRPRQRTVRDGVQVGRLC